MNNRQWFRTGLVASVVLALCCVTPVLFLAITALGLSAYAGWLDYVLIPLFLVTAILTWLAWRRCRKNEACSISNAQKVPGKGLRR